MKSAGMYLLLLALIIIAIPMLIVRSCGSEKVKTPSSVQEADLKIKVYNHLEKKVMELPFEEYIKGVVAAEMPAAFELEALKAQAVAARTYAYGRMVKLYTPKDDTHNGAEICTDSTHCQAWTDKETVMKKWGFFNASRNRSKINKAVMETQGMIIVYENNIVNPVFHSNSGGKTENAEDVWEGSPVPYLKSVESKGEKDNPAFENCVILSFNEFCTKVKSEYPDVKINEANIFKSVKILENTEGGRVKNIKIGNITIKGTDFRKLFALKSANFKFEKQEKDKIKITTYGNGHGVGMSQWGANSMAKNGKKFEEILKYYYKGVAVKPIDSLDMNTK